MPKLYIANATKQKIQLSYWPLDRVRERVRNPESRQGIVTQMIPIGGQIAIVNGSEDNDLSIEEIDFVIKQHRRYGLIPVGELDSSKLPFQGMCYSIGEPVSPDRLHRAMWHNEQTLETQGKELRKQAALAVNNQIEEGLQENLKALRMSVAEVEPPGGYPGDHEPLGEGVHVTREVSNA